MAFNYAEKWADDNLDIMIEQSLTGMFIIPDNKVVEWSRNQTFHFTQTSTSGFQQHSRNGGWNAGTITQVDVPFQILHDRDVEFLVDKADVDETNETASAEKITNTFLKTQVVPEIDALYYARVSTKALSVGGLFSATDVSTYTKATIYPALKVMLTAGRLRAYAGKGSLVMHITSELMSLLEEATDFTRKIETTSVSVNGTDLNTRVTSINGVPIIEVVDTERFYTGFDFSDGFVPAVGAFKINVLISSLDTCITVPKISSIYFFAPGDHTKGDGYLYQHRAFWDTFVMPNGKNNVIDSIFVDRDTTAVT